MKRGEEAVKKQMKARQQPIIRAEIGLSWTSGRARHHARGWRWPAQSGDLIVNIAASHQFPGTAVP